MVRRRNRRMQVCIPALVLAIIFFILSASIYFPVLSQGCWWKLGDKTSGIIDYIALFIVIIIFTVYEYNELEEQNAKNQLWVHLFIIGGLWVLKIFLLGCVAALFGILFIEMPCTLFCDLINGIFGSSF